MQSLCWREQQGAALRALSVALQQPSLCQDARDVCTLSQVCRSWRAMAQNSTAGLLTVRFAWQISKGTALRMRSISSLSTWLSRYPGLVRKLKIEVPSESTDVDHLWFTTAVENLLADSIKQAVSGDPAAPTRPALKIRSFTAVQLTRTALLEVLPVGCLSRLSVDMMPDQSCSSPPAAWAAAIGRLTELQVLSIGCIGSLDAVPHGLLAHTSNLQHLTRLELPTFDMAEACLRQLPQTLRILKLWSNFAGYSADGSVLQFQHLTNLKQLDLDVTDGEMLTVAPLLPTQLEELNVNEDLANEGFRSSLPCVGLWNLTLLQQLTRLAVCNDSHQPHDITPLAALTGLRYLRLGYYSSAATLAAAPAWKQLPQLRDLSVVWRQQNSQHNVLTTQQLCDLMQYVAAATNLQRLTMRLEAHAGARLGVLRYLTTLTGLQELHISGLNKPDALASNDALHLSALRDLTALSFSSCYLSGCPSGVGDMVAVALACQLTSLVDWDLTGCGLKTAAVVPAIQVHQKRLKRLKLRLNDYRFTVDDVVVLTSLSDLTI